MNSESTCYNIGSVSISAMSCRINQCRLSSLGLITTSTQCPLSTTTTTTTPKLTMTPWRLLNYPLRLNLILNWSLHMLNRSWKLTNLMLHRPTTETCSYLSLTLARMVPIIVCTNQSLINTHSYLNLLRSIYFGPFLRS